MTLSRTSELEALNSVLSMVGLSPQASLSGLQGEPATAYTILNEISRAVQQTSWHWNTDYDVTFTPDPTTGEIAVGSDVVRIDQMPGVYTDLDVTQRGDKLYDRKTNSFVFTDEIECEVVRLLEWTDLPEPARRYVLTRAGRTFLQRVRSKTNRQMIDTLLADEALALAELRSMESETADHSIFDSRAPYDVIHGRGVL